MDIHAPYDLITGCSREPERAAGRHNQHVEPRPAEGHQVAKRSLYMPSSKSPGRDDQQAGHTACQM